MVVLGQELCETAVGAQDLGVYPSTIGTCEEGDDSGNVFGLAEAFERRQLAHLRDLFVAFAAKEEFRPDGSGGDGVDRDLAAAQFIGQHVDQTLYTGLRCNVRSVVGERLGQDAARESDDSAAFGDVLRGLREHEKGASQIRGNDAVEDVDLASGDRGERHDAGIVNDDIDGTEALESFGKQTFDIGGIGDICLDGDCLVRRRPEFRPPRRRPAAALVA